MNRVGANFSVLRFLRALSLPLLVLGGLAFVLTDRVENASAVIIPSPNSSATLDNQLEAVDCVSSIFCVAVGSFNNGSAEQTLILNWNGTTWSTMQSPNNSNLQHSLRSVACVSDSFCTAVGFYQGGSGLDVLIMNWDGSTWSIAPVAVPASSILSSVSCVSSSFCIAVGNSGQLPMQTLVLKWDGTSWAQIPSPNTSPSLPNSLQGVSCDATSHCFAVGLHNDGNSNLTLSLEWDGTNWSQIPTPNPSRGPAPSQNNSLYDVSCSSNSVCSAVGYFGFLSAGRSLVLQWDGTQWSQVESPEPTGYKSPLFSVSCFSGNLCAAVGTFKDYGVVLSHPFVVWSGNLWEQQPVDDVGIARNELNGVSCYSATNCFAVGFFENLNVKQTLIMDLTRPLPRAKPSFTG